MDRLGLTQPTVSKHLRVLKDARLVDVELDSWLAPYRELWNRRLDLTFSRGMYSSSSSRWLKSGGKRGVFECNRVGTAPCSPST